ncbi:helix-turn-helix domain-containing protein [Bifidobacterium breve]|uniref:helix-turn-helix domain-containing protein n=1 Tax=Bifidobacterium breve TaxID=1685 RepID=UPI001E307BE9|nr:helix-turn-helix domain-containing protein [Bifidobacterium breve]
METTTTTVQPAMNSIASQLDPLSSPQQVSDVTGIPVNTLAYWRCEGMNLPFTKMGRVVRYRREDVLEYIERNTFSSTAGAKAGRVVS